MDRPRVVVIGGASGGLGPAVVKAFYEQGDNVVLVGRKPDGLREVAGTLDLAEERSLLVDADQTNAEAVQSIVEKTNDTFGPIDVLVNVTGGYRGGSVAETEPKDWNFMIALNLTTAFLAANAVLPGMLERGSGKLIFVSSRSGQKLSGGASGYVTSKAGLDGLVKNMAEEVRFSGVNVNAVSPSMIDTPSNRGFSPDADYSKWVTPESLADVILFLASDAARDVHGAIIPVTGKV